MSQLAKRRHLAWSRLVAADVRMQVALRAFLRERGTTLAQFDLLSTLHRWGGTLTVTELSRFLLVSLSNTSGVVNRLEAAGFVRRGTSAADRRAVTVTLTSKGGASFERLVADHEVEVDRLLAGLGGPDVEALVGLLEHVAPGVERPPQVRRRPNGSPR